MELRHHPLVPPHRGGTLHTWGRARHGALGLATDSDVDVPRSLAGLPRVRQVACGEMHCVALAADGTVLTWGSGLMGALGNGDLGTCRTPSAVLALRTAAPIVEIAAGRHHSLALSLSGDAFHWGMCGGAIGECHTVPRQRADLNGRATSVACGDDFCAALTHAVRALAPWPKPSAGAHRLHAPRRPSPRARLYRPRIGSLPRLRASLRVDIAPLFPSARAPSHTPEALPSAASVRLAGRRRLGWLAGSRRCAAGDLIAKWRAPGVLRLACAARGCRRDRPPVGGPLSDGRWRRRQPPAAEGRHRLIGGAIDCHRAAARAPLC